MPDRIEFTNITLDDAGEYVCTAENSAGFVSSTNVLNVHQSPIVSLYPNTPTLQLTEGDELRLECSAVGVPAPRVIWFDNVQSESPDEYADQLIQSTRLDLSHAVLHKYKVRKSDEGYYLCRASNAAGSEDKYITVYINEKRGDVGE